MSRDNGIKILTFVGTVLGSFLAVSLAINTLVYAPLNNAICAEVQNREKADKEESVNRENDKKDLIKYLGSKMDKILDCQTAQACSITRIEERLKIDDK